MGNATFYYYPDPRGGLEVVDLGGGLQSLPNTLQATSRVDRVMGGEVYSTKLGQVERVPFTREGISDLDLVADLESLESHLKGGAGSTGFSADHAKTWGGYVPTGLRRGSTVLRTGGNAYAAFSGSGAITTGDYVVIESGYPEFHREVRRVASVSGGTVTLAEGLRFSYSLRPVLVRWHRFWPSLYLDGRQPLVSHVVPGVVYRMTFDGFAGAAATASAALAAPLLEGGTGPVKGGGKVTQVTQAAAVLRDPIRASDIGLPGKRR